MLALAEPSAWELSLPARFRADRAGRSDRGTGSCPRERQRPPKFRAAQCVAGAESGPGSHPASRSQLPTAGGSRRPSDRAPAEPTTAGSSVAGIAVKPYLIGECPEVNLRFGPIRHASFEARTLSSQREALPLKGDEGRWHRE